MAFVGSIVFDAWRGADEAKEVLDTNGAPGETVGPPAIGVEVDNDAISFCVGNGGIVGKIVGWAIIPVEVGKMISAVDINTGFMPHPWQFSRT
jgi:hypothetical protein